MKKLLLVLAIASLIVCCKKEKKPTPAPAPTTTTPTDPKWTYSWDYKKTGDNTTYSAQACFTPTEMTTQQQLVSAFNIQQWGRCN